jgi:alkylation response protein AidB-like acyl-CoA dehydrogenase
VTSVLRELHLGRLRWDLLNPFPVQEPADQAAGAAARSQLRALLAELVDPDQVDTDRALPAGLTAALAGRGFLAMSVPAADGGLGLSPLNVFRLLETAGARSTAVGMFLAWQNTLGVAAYLEFLPPGRQRELVLARLAQGAVGGLGDSEPAGAANPRRATVAVPTGGGYLLTGEKLFVGNGSSADLLTVTATVRDRAGERIDLFLVDTRSPGFRVVGVHDLLGLAGSPIAAVALDRVFVPAEQVLATAAGGWRSSPPAVRRAAFARMAITVTQTLAPARSCLGWVRNFLARRAELGGRPLSEYQAVQRRLAESLADVFAVDSVVEWCLLGEPGADRLPELTAAKNIGTMISWRVIDRAVSLLGGEGLERPASKTRRGAPPLPVERALRDARCLRVAGGVDFNIDLRAGWSMLAPRYQPGDRDGEAAPMGPVGAGLSAANRRHLELATTRIGELSARCDGWVARYPADQLVERQETLIAANRIADELFTMVVVLARAARLTASAGAAPGAAGPAIDAERLAEVYCQGAQIRIAQLWQTLDALDAAPDDQRGHPALSRAWLAGAGSLTGLLMPD